VPLFARQTIRAGRFIHSHTAIANQMPADDQGGRNGRDGQEYAGDTRHLGAGKQSEKNKDRMHSDPRPHQSWTKDLILEDAIAENEKQYPQQMGILGHHRHNEDEER